MAENLLTLKKRAVTAECRRTRQSRRIVRSWRLSSIRRDRDRRSCACGEEEDRTREEVGPRRLRSRRRIVRIRLPFHPPRRGA